ncbi:MAG: NFACT family protein, partial [Caldilineaceae bacterium]|nr:NFACT family protein [Caldilineaceae bacterium]
MHFDALTVACIAAELQRTVEGGRVQQVIAPDEQSIGMELYAQQQRIYLLLSADPRKSRVHTVQEKLRRGVETVSPLLLLLRKYVRGSQLTTVEQPDVTERLLHFHFFHPEHGETQLVVELIGQRSNLILLGEPQKEPATVGQRLILDSLRRMWASEGVQRPVMPKQPYAPPSPQEKLLPILNIDGSGANGSDANGSGVNGKGSPANGKSVSMTQLRLLLRAGDSLWRALVNNFAGVSPTLAREIAWRATGTIDAMA